MSSAEHRNYFLTELNVEIKLRSSNMITLAAFMRFN